MVYLVSLTACLVFCAGVIVFVWFVVCCYAWLVALMLDFGFIC